MLPKGSTTEAVRKPESPRAVTGSYSHGEWWIAARCMAAELRLPGEAHISVLESAGRTAWLRQVVTA